MFIFLTSIRCILWVIILLNISQNVFGFQCYSCKSPLRGTIKGEFLRALQDFDNQPKEIADCAIPSDKLPKITCHSNVCMKTVFNPKDISPFVVRYCADNAHVPPKHENMKEACVIMPEKTIKEYQINCLCKNDLCNSSGFITFSLSFVIVMGVCSLLIM